MYDSEEDIDSKCQRAALNCDIGGHKSICYVKTEDEAETLNFPLCENYASNVIFIIIWTSDFAINVLILGFHFFFQNIDVLRNLYFHTELVL